MSEVGKNETTPDSRKVPEIFSFDWCMKMAGLEGNAEIGAGRLAMDDIRAKFSADQNWPIQSFDAMDWAKAFMEKFGDKHDQIDESLMLAWFANALMRGWDERQRKGDAVNIDLLAALGLIASQAGMTLIAPSMGSDYDQGHRVGANKAFDQMANVARDAINKAEGR